LERRPRLTDAPSHFGQQALWQLLNEPIGQTQSFIAILETRRAPTGIGALLSSPATAKPQSHTRLFQRRIDARELVVEGRAQAVYGRDNRKRDARCNQAILDGGGSRFILQELRKRARQSNLMVRTETRVSPGSTNRTSLEKAKIERIKVINDS
jgi:hypothetical protein